MRSVNSYSNALRKELFRKGWLLAAIAFITYFLIDILPVLMNYHSAENIMPYSDSNMFGASFLSTLVDIAMPVVMSVVCFDYLHDKASVTVTHARPITRPQLFNLTALYGYVMMMIPVILIGLLLLPLAGAQVSPGADMSEYDYQSAAELFTVRNSLAFIGHSAVIIGFIFAMSNLAAVIAGRRAIHVLLALFINGAPIAIAGLLEITLEWALYGYQSGFELLPRLHPAVYVYSGGTLYGWIIFLVVIAAVHALSILLYRKIKLERTGDACFFPAIATLLCILLTFLFSVTLGLVFAELLNAPAAQEAPFIIFTLLASVVGLIITRMIADSTVHVFGPRLLKTAGIYAVCIAVFFAVTIVDVTGYETRIPDVSQIKSVQVTGIAGGDFEEQAPVLTSPSAIQQATAFHRSIVEDRAGNNPEMGSNIINVVYNLKNGRAVFRTYTDVAVPAGSDKYKAMDALYRDPEYAAALKVTFSEKMLKSIAAVDLLQPGKEDYTTIDMADLPELLAAFQKDYSARTLQQQLDIWNDTDGQDCWLEFSPKEEWPDENIMHDIRFDRTIDKNLTRLLKEKGYLK